jgi:hypothetical protein
MAITLDISGVLQAAAFWVSNKGGTNGRRLYFYFYVMLTLFSALVGNDPVVWYFPHLPAQSSPHPDTFWHGLSHLLHP